MPTALRAAYVAAVQTQAPEEYRFELTANGFQAESAAQDLRVELGAKGVQVASSAGAWTFQAAASRWGCDGDLMEVEPATPEAEGNRATYRRNGFDEWYLHGPLGLEQGFTLRAPPPCRKAGGNDNGKSVIIELGGGLDASVSAHGKEAVLRDASGQAVLRYTDLYVVDAVGKELPAELAAEAGRLSVRFEDAEAVYPVTVDPLIWVQQDKLLASDGVANDYFGISVAVSGNTAVVGAWYNASYTGAAYVFVRSGSSWSEQQKLTASDGAVDDHFGTSVAVSGETALVGAYKEALYQGAAYVFVRSGSSWSEQQKLTASDGAGGDFGISVALSGETALVGASGKSSNTGAAYVFVRSGSSWSEQQKLTASDAGGSDLFGHSVAVSGETALVGAWRKASYQGAAYVFARSGASWSEQQKLTASDGTQNDRFGISVALSGETALVGATEKASYQGAAYVFARSGASWSEQQKLTASDGTQNDSFGISVALSGETALVGAYGKAASQGAAYMFARSGASWSEQQKLTASDGTQSDQFGRSVALSGETALVAAPGKASAQGAAYALTLKSTNGDPCANATQCTSGFCTDGVCCEVAACAASDQCHGIGTCQPDTGVCSNPVKADDSPCEAGTCQAGVCETGTTTGTGGGSNGGAGGSSNGGAGGAGGGSSTMAGAGGTGGNTPEAPMDLSCGCSTPGTSTSSRAAWLGAFALLALYRRRRPRSRSVEPSSPDNLWT